MNPGSDCRRPPLLHRGQARRGSLPRRPSSLAGARVSEGRTCSAYPACRAGGTTGGICADIPIDQAVAKRNLVSAPRGRPPAWIAQFCRLLGTRISL